MIIDFHTHIFPDAIASATVQKLGGISHTRAFTDGTAQNLLESMSRAGVDLSILLPVATRPGQCTSINRFAARINEQHDHLLSLGNYAEALISTFREAALENPNLELVCPKL